MLSYKKHVDAIVYTMGKVGSSTVSQSLRAAGLNCLDIHFLEKRRIVETLDAQLSNPDAELVPRHFIDSLLARNAIQRQGRVKIVTLVREPVARNISAVFQNLPKRLSGDENAILERLRDYPVRTPDFWFETDFIPATGFDIFNAALDRGADSFRAERDNLDILVLKLETGDDRKAEILSDFLSVSVTLERANEASAKWYYDSYKLATADPRGIRQQFVDDCFALNYFNALYSDSEKQNLRGKFSGAEKADASA